MIIKREHIVWCIVDFGDGSYYPKGELIPPLELTTVHKVLEFDTEQEFLDKCAELDIEIEDFEV